MERLFVKSTSAVLLCLRHKTPKEVIGLSFNRRVYIYDTTTLRHNSERMAVAAVAVAVENDTRSGRRCGCGWLRCPPPAITRPPPRPPARFLGGIRSHMVSYKFIVIGPSLGRRMAAECGGGWRRMAEDGDGWRRGGGRRSVVNRHTVQGPGSSRHYFFAAFFSWACPPDPPDLAPHGATGANMGQ